MMLQSSFSPSTQTDSLLSNLAEDRIGLVDANHSSVIGDANTTSRTFTIDKNSSNTLKNIFSSPNDWLQLPKMDTFVDLFALCCSIAVIVGSLVPYIPQYLKIKRSQSSDGFSTYGMLFLMELCVRVRDRSSSFTISLGGSNRQRRLINGKRSIRSADENQSSSSSSSVYAVSSPSSANQVAGVTLSDSCSYHNWRPTTRPDAVLAPNGASTNDGVDEIGKDPSFRYESLSPSCSIKAQHRYQSLMGNINNSSDSCALGTRDFWDWDNFNSYLYFLFLFTLVTSLLTYLLIDNHLYIETLGFVAVLTESMLGIPQLLRNYSKKSTLGMSVVMVGMWLSGDLFKTLYFIFRHAPPQFIVCGSIQIIVDILILYQVLWYRRPRVNYRKLPTSVTR